MPAHHQDRSRVYLDASGDLHARIGKEAEARGLSVSYFASHLLEEALAALRPVTDWRLTALPTYDPTELEKRRHSSSRPEPCANSADKLEHSDYTYCPDCGWHRDQHQP